MARAIVEFIRDRSKRFQSAKLRHIHIRAGTDSIQELFVGDVISLSSSVEIGVAYRLARESHSQQIVVKPVIGEFQDLFGHLRRQPDQAFKVVEVSLVPENLSR